MERYEAIVVGSLLGDGWLGVRSKIGTAVFGVKYKSASLPYLEWIHSELAILGLKDIRPKPNYDQYMFYSKPSIFFGDYRKLFYPDNIKIVPDNVESLLTDPISLAVWYMDDGSLDQRPKSHCTANIATYGFTFEDCHKLKSAIKKNFNLDVGVHKVTCRKVTYFRLYVFSKTVPDFMNLIKPYILPCFSYKLPKTLL